jgi:hypothetical protein
MTLCGNTLPSSASNGVATYIYDWDCNGGVMNSVDNSIGTKSFAYNDPLYRTTQATDENDATVNYSFSATSGEGTMTFGSSTVDGIVNVDPFGNKLSTQVKNGTNYDTTSHMYLGNHLASDSLPCSAALGGTCAITKYSYTYDSVGRLSVKTDVTTGATRVYSYNANDTLVTVSGGTSPVHKVQTEVDGLGRLISVCEITTLPGSGSCRQTTAATGFLTTYQYTPVGLLSTITQFANGSSAQTRTFTYDKIGRKLTENTPEGGLVQFFYDTAPSAPGVACPGNPLGMSAWTQWGALRRLRKQPTAMEPACHWSVLLSIAWVGRSRLITAPVTATHSSTVLRPGCRLAIHYARALTGFRTP